MARHGVGCPPYSFDLVINPRACVRGVQAAAGIGILVICKKPSRSFDGAGIHDFAR
jgi:hypothetical protein